MITHFGERHPEYGGIPICAESLSGPATDCYSMDRDDVTCPDCIRELMRVDAARDEIESAEVK